jgi:hypothetical protein
MNEADAKKQFFMLTYLRFSGVALAMAGIAIIAKRWIEPADLVGGAVLVLGIVNVIILPPLLIRNLKRKNS